MPVERHSVQLWRSCEQQGSVGLPYGDSLGEVLVLSGLLAVAVVEAEGDALGLELMVGRSVGALLGK